MKWTIATVCLYFLLLTGSAFSQNTPQPALKEVFSKASQYGVDFAAERIYMHTDKSSYLAGDTIWLKGYVMNSMRLNASTKSGLLYVELADDSNQLVKRIMLPLYYGLTYGCIPLDEEMRATVYTLRAYTNWMRNAGEDYMFKKPIHIRKIKDDDWIVNYNYRVIKDSGKQTVNLGFKVQQFDKTPVGLREMRVSVIGGNRTLWRKNTETTYDGLLNMTFKNPDLKQSKS